MKILVTNDDGIHAQGVLALAECLDPFGEITVVAPDRQRSSTGHAISLDHPIRCWEVGSRRFACNGTPVDCIVVALTYVLGGPPDIVFSGINHGGNLGCDVFYSGTVQAAVEAALHGIPAVAMSVAEFREPQFEAAGRFAAGLVEWLSAGRLWPGMLLNVNVPCRRGEPPPERFAVTRMGARRYEVTAEERVDPRGQRYFWVGGKPLPHEQFNGGDSQAVREGLISVTPLGFDLTDGGGLERLRAIDVRGFARSG